MTQTIRISSNPEGLVSAPVGSFFYRRGEKYFLINGVTESEDQLFNMTKAAFFRKYYNPDFYKKCTIEYVSEVETWIKVDRSRGDKFGWQFVAYRPPTFVGEHVVAPSPTPVASFTPTPTPTPTLTPSVTPEPTPSSTPMETPTPTATITPSVTMEPTPTPTSTVTPTPTEIVLPFSMIVEGGNGLDVYFNGHTPFGTMPTWSYGDGSPEVIDWFPTTHSYATYGTYQVTASTFDFTGSVVSASAEVTLVAPSGPEFFSVGYSNGSDANFARSPDASGWSTRYVDNQGQLNAVCIGGDVIVSVEGGYTSYDQPIDPSGSTADIHVSTDFGETWTTHFHSTFYPTGGHLWSDVVYSDGTFIVVSEQGAVVRSTDNGQSWTASVELLGSSLRRAAVGGTSIVQLSSGFYSGSDFANNYHGKLSRDGGLTWMPIASNVNGAWSGVAYGATDRGFVAVAPFGAVTAMESMDGENWDSNVSYANVYGHDIAYGHAGYVVVTGDDSSVVWTINGPSWEGIEHSGSLPAEGAWRSITYGNGRYVAVNARSDSGPAAMYSTDGINWTAGTGAPSQSSWVDVVHRVTTTPTRYLLDTSTYYTLGRIPTTELSDGTWYSPGGDYTLDGNIYIWKVTGQIESGSLMCTNIRNLLGTVNVTSHSYSIIDITDIITRDTYDQNSAIIFTVVGDGSSFTGDLMTNATLVAAEGDVHTETVRRVPYLTVSNAGYPAMIHVANNTTSQYGFLNTAIGLQLSNVTGSSGIIQLRNGYPTTIQYFEYSENPLARYIVDSSQLTSMLSIPTGSVSNLKYYPSGQLTEAWALPIHIWKVDVTVSGSEYIAGQHRELLGEIGVSAESDITNLVSAAGLNDPYSTSAIVFTTTGDYSSTTWDVMTSASIVQLTGSTEAVTVRQLPTTFNNNPRIMDIRNDSDEKVGEVAFAGAVMFNDVYNSFAKIVLGNGYPLPPTYVEYAQVPPAPTPTPTPTPAPTPPENDDFQAAYELIDESGVEIATNEGATDDPNDPTEVRSYPTTVWWKWTPPISDVVTGSITTEGSTFDTLLYVYKLTGPDSSSQSNLTFIGSDDDSAGSGASAINFYASVGDVYYIAVSGFGGASGTIQLNYEVAYNEPPPAM